MTNHCFLNDRLLPEAEARISTRDLGLQRGYGCFDFFRVSAGRPYFLPDHLDRFFRSAAALQLPVPFTREALTRILEEVCRANRLQSGGLRLTLTGGHSEDCYSIGTPTLLITAHTFSLPTAAQWSSGLHLLTHPFQRQLPGVKTTDYLMAILLQPRLRAEGADDLLYVSEGEVRECPRANFFAVTDSGTLVTPDRNILEGITRKHLLQLCPHVIASELRAFRTEELGAAREAFITSSTKGVLPVTRIDGRPVGTGKPGPVTAELKRLFEEMARDMPSW